MPGRWVSEEEYYALLGGSVPSTQNPQGVNATSSMSGKVLESKAGPQTLEQRDFQETALTHDLMTQTGLNERETSAKIINYAEVNSTLTERAPSIDHTFQQDEAYTETYQTRVENTNSEKYTRTTMTPQYTKAHNTLNLNAPTTLTRNATEQMTRTINQRNASIDTHTMVGY